MFAIIANNRNKCSINRVKLAILTGLEIIVTIKSEIVA